MLETHFISSKDDAEQIAHECLPFTRNETFLQRPKSTLNPTGLYIFNYLSIFSILLLLSLFSSFFSFSMFKEKMNKEILPGGDQWPTAHWQCPALSCNYSDPNQQIFQAHQYKIIRTLLNINFLCTTQVCSFPTWHKCTGLNDKNHQKEAGDILMVDLFDISSLMVFL